MVRFSLVTLAVFLVGCAGSPIRIINSSPEQLQAESSVNLCRAYKHSPKQEIKAELQRRAAIPDDEWTYIDQHQIKVGMSVLGLVCSWGGPGMNVKVNQTVTARGVHQQWVYGSSNYVYVEDGKVTAFQSFP